jgi:hypothetical protein
MIAAAQATPFTLLLPHKTEKSSNKTAPFANTPTSFSRPFTRLLTYRYRMCNRLFSRTSKRASCRRTAVIIRHFKPPDDDSPRPAGEGRVRESCSNRNAFRSYKENRSNQNVFRSMRRENRPTENAMIAATQATRFTLLLPHKTEKSSNKTASFTTQTNSFPRPFTRLLTYRYKMCRRVFLRTSGSHLDLEPMQSSVVTNHRRTIHPLLAGEGRGEGESLK